MNSIANIIERQEALCAELALYRGVLVIGKKKMSVLKHPLVYSIPHDEQMNAFCNEQYRWKKKAVDKAWNENDWPRIIAMHERPWRWDALRQIIDHGIELSDEVFGDLFAGVWTDSENVWQNKRIIKQCLPRIKAMAKQYLHSDDDQKAYDKLPSVVVVYRGSAWRNLLGMSWTLDEAKARWFGKRFVGQGAPYYVQHGEVAKVDVLFYCGVRNEQEIVAEYRHVKPVTLTPYRT